MATEVTSLNELNSDLVKEQQDILTTFLVEAYPNIDLSRGVMRDLVQYLNAVFAAKERTELERWKSARSLLAIMEDPSIADDDSVDNILSNYNVTRREGTYATGTVFLEFKEDLSKIIPSNITFVFNNLTFRTTTSYMVLDSETTGSAIADRVLIPLSNGNYGCTIDVTANQVGSDSCLTRGTELDCTDITALVSATVYNDFYGGTDEETNEELILRLKSGIATKCWGNRYNIDNLLRNDPTLASLVDISVIGMHEPEMTRDQITLFPVSVGGKTDIYVKTAPTTYTVTTPIYATLTAKDINYDYWSIQVPSSVLPGFWRITGIEYISEVPDSTIVELQKQEVASDSTEYTALDASYTVHQVVNATFRTPISETTKVNDSVQFNVTVMGLPSIDYVQELCTARTIVPVTSDVLIKSAVPCITTVTVVIKQSKHNPVAEDTIFNIKNTITTAINNKGFTGYLTASELMDSIQDLLDQSQRIASMQLTGIILGPNGTMVRDVSNKQLVIPDMPLNYITANTTSFFSDVSYIDVVLETIDA